MGRKLCPFSSFNIMGHPIYSMTAKVITIKNKRPQSRNVWIVSKYDNPSDIMKKDGKTMSRLERELFTAKAKNKTIVIDSITSIKQVGATSDET